MFFRSAGKKPTPTSSLESKTQNAQSENTFHDQTTRLTNITTVGHLLRHRRPSSLPIQPRLPGPDLPIQSVHAFAFRNSIPVPLTPYLRFLQMSGMTAGSIIEADKRLRDHGAWQRRQKKVLRDAEVWRKYEEDYEEKAVAAEMRKKQEGGE